MGRFSSVQSFADNHNAVRKVAYEQISGTAATTSTNTTTDTTTSAAVVNTTGSTSSNGGKGTTGSTTTTGNSIAYVPPEKVINPYGSTAGAGSGEFHIYRHSRNRELQRQKFMELSAQEQQLEQQYQQQLLENQQWEIQRTAKRQKKRQRQKDAKKRKENLRKAGVDIRVVTTATDDDDDDDNDFDDNEDNTIQDTVNSSHEKDKLQLHSPDETMKQNTILKPVDTKLLNAIIDTTTTTTTTLPALAIEIPKDGSFLETMKQLLQQNKT